MIPFRAFLNCGKVQCSAVTECGKVYLMEVNSIGNFYHRYPGKEKPKIDFDKRSKLKAATVSPSACMLVVSFEKENIYLKSQDPPITKLVIYPIMKEEEYESILINVFKNQPVNFAPIIFDIIIHLKLINSGSVS